MAELTVENISISVNGQELTAPGINLSAVFCPPELQVRDFCCIPGIRLFGIHLYPFRFEGKVRVDEVRVDEAAQVESLKNGNVTLSFEAVTPIQRIEAH